MKAAIFHVKSGGFHVKSTQNLHVKSKDHFQGIVTLSVWGVQGGGYDPFDFTVKSWVYRCPYSWQSHQHTNTLWNSGNICWLRWRFWVRFLDSEDPLDFHRDFRKTSLQGIAFEYRLPVSRLFHKLGISLSNRSISRCGYSTGRIVKQLDKLEVVGNEILPDCQPGKNN